MENKNLIPEIAKLLGVEIGEEFLIENTNCKKTAVLAMDGLLVTFPNGMAEMDDGQLLLEVLEGFYEVKKLPWKPQNGDKYYAINIADATTPYITCARWNGYVRDYASLQLGIIYKTEEEAKSHMIEDYQKLTGKNGGKWK